MNRKIIVFLPLFLLLFVPVASASTNITSIIETGLPQGTQWQYEVNGQVFNTTLSVVTGINSANVQVLPLTGYSESTTTSTTFLYVNFNATSFNPDNFTALVPYLSIFMIFGVLGLAALVVVRRRR